LKKKKITQEEFDKKIKLWSLIIVPLIVCLITSLTAIIVAYISQEEPEVEYKISEEDQLMVNRLSAQIKVLSERYFQTQDPIEKERLNAELLVLAEAEAKIMRKYNPGYILRWPKAPASHGLQIPKFVAYILSISFILAVIYGIVKIILFLYDFIKSRVVDRILRARYEIKD
jgi:uncharacterized membrane protein